MRVSAEVLNVLATQVAFVLVNENTDNENTGIKLTGQLDRSLYTKVNKVLEACGGKWNRKAKAHVFGTDSAEGRIELVLSTGEVQTASDLGFFPTPEPLAREFVQMADVNPGDRVLEPSAGMGNIVRAIQDAGGTVTAVEWDVQRGSTLLHDVLKSRDVLIDQPDFMATSMKHMKLKPFDAVVMNPPFCKVGLGDHLDHVRHAYSMLRPRGVLVSVLPGGVTFRQDSRHKQFRAWVEEHGTIEDLPEDSFAESGTKVRTCVARMVRA